MYIVNYGFGSVTFDWINPVKKIGSLFPDSAEDRIILCMVDNPITDQIDLWKCNAQFDYRYDLKRFYEFTYHLDFSEIDYFFTPITEFIHK